MNEVLYVSFGWVGGWDVPFPKEAAVGCIDVHVAHEELLELCGWVGRWVGGWFG